ncbi:ACP S-malonyltransferase [Campylobacter sp. JMF_07 ED4]|uniref:ACP S-malonyltransferase n=1 Tax=unclassified Campylobacter TaxID=2593542 RepID=UPI0022E9FA63|nr:MULTISPECIES: ACP S-malonyltransferase [unclassified Campylobacter]MDA3043170.1 ACP S-malonyltransferase [Campylobacter sp. JMF_09 ED2]MDA3044792.1 ACP S-malonyltransferase [Campylobacter sp. JMF_07 ED4]MDA3063828.1 ACP S-malonyltransferase [Campylobacter sp. JMF_11 EL3]MDA3072123.1 ACP S-malonyltransferase [Campylobacter sp. VBCF_03 NA9]
MKYAFIFPGQGSQSVGMGREIYENFASAKELLDTASAHTKIDFANLLFEANDKLDISEFTQPSIALNSMMCVLALNEQIKISPEFLLGHSLGEFSALGAAGAIEAKEILRLVNIRGKLMQNACEGKNAGMMVVLALSDEVVCAICDEARAQGKQVWAANFNCDGQIVVAGNRDDLASLEAKFKEAGAKRAMLLNMSVASHCPMLQSASDELVSHLEPALNESFAPVVANATAKIYSTKSEALGLLKAQLISPVLYKHSVKNYENSVDCFVEFGASVLKGINKKITDKPTFSISNLSSLEEFVKFAKENA